MGIVSTVIINSRTKLTKSVELYAKNCIEQAEAEVVPSSS